MNRPIFRLLLIPTLIAGAFGACGKKSSYDPNAAVTATYSSISTNILSKACTECHGSSRSAGGFRFDSYAETIKALTASNSAASKLFTEVNSGSMPEGGEKLATAHIDAIKTWIDAGAANN